MGLHHAGMLRSDRNLVERLFADGLIKVGGGRGAGVGGGDGCGGLELGFGFGGWSGRVDVLKAGSVGLVHLLPLC